MLNSHGNYTERKNTIQRQLFYIPFTKFAREKIFKKCQKETKKYSRKNLGENQFNGKT